ncbi:pyruvate oxidase [Weissella oryzae SG25]|uniref:Pyruvate oxidase n=1 Tax=Weissella oryzae (strain DSM 25784 / JCM 18191 / LMG 30913 / SG25) TaxID=1329250 RepID=A0A069CS79_WEIOS|nr:pyruvate oxidase [Weissella oryzae]GAK30269.1 pyruvate oxidase [Weissella oryzae SG25]
MANDQKMIKAGDAMVKVLEAWDVDHLYGIPGGSINSTMDALLDEKSSIKYIQVRHEEVGAMAAAADAKLTGKIGVAFGSAGPGGTHLLNGLYDAREDHVPVLALVGQFGTSGMNMDTFQEMNENPIYADVAVYNVTVVTAESLPHIIDEAIRRAYAQHGVAVVQIPVDLPWQEIPAESWYASANSFQKPVYEHVDIEQAQEITDILTAAKRPLIYFGIGAKQAGAELAALAEKLKIPLMSTYPAKAILPDRQPYYLGSANRVAHKPANEALAQADVVLFVGSNYPFAEVSKAFKHVEKFLQIDIDPAKLGKRHYADVAMLADAKRALAKINELASEKAATPWWQANLANVANWNEYLVKLESKKDGPLQAYQAYAAINKITNADTIFSLDVGDVNQLANRHLILQPSNRHFTSNLFATMGVGIPGAIAAKLNYPERQVLSLSGDGGAAMVMQDLVTEVQYHLPIINVVFSNHQFGFIKDEQEDTNKGYLGVTFNDINFAKVAEAVGMKGFRVTEINQLADVFAKAKEIGQTEPVLVDVVITNERPIPVEAMVLDPRRYDAEAIEAFKKRYEAEDLQPFAKYLADYGVVIDNAEIEQGGF